MEQETLNSLMDDVLPLCNDLNGSPNHLYDWMTAGNKDGFFNGWTAEQIAELWNDEMAAYRRSEAARALRAIPSKLRSETSRKNGSAPVKPGSNPRGRPPKQA